MRLNAFLFLLLGIILPVKAQEIKTGKEYAEAIEDNSFLMEEAYNQEERVVQHISNAYYRTGPSKDVAFSFTQEWPMFKYKHQLSYTIPFSFIDGNSIRGLGDMLINYRYQVTYKEDWACFSPRLSLILPTGAYLKSLGYDVLGVQINLPVSKRISDDWVVHANAGYTLLPKARIVPNENHIIRKTLSFYNLGGSIIWLTSANFNCMLECVENFNSDVNTNGTVERSTELIINPGIRAAINLGDLQIVPGISFPFFNSGHGTDPGFLFYLSFEHPY
jgi:hypothetical protein